MNSHPIDLTTNDLDPFSLGVKTQSRQSPSTNRDPNTTRTQPKIRFPDSAWRRYQATSNAFSFSGEAYGGAGSYTLLDRPKTCIDPQLLFTSPNLTPAASTTANPTSIPPPAAPAWPTPTPQAQTPPSRSRKFRCSMCPRTFDRASRVEDCHNRHLDCKPHKCLGRCANVECTAEYGSIEQLKRHFNRFGPCLSCGEILSRQNMARHRVSHGH
ncbi:hypothetical protein M408DRAFT_26084 [Serendipita vermifera MAFF 305830]|uniref:C2H2-type domain-containing protein n=1 Tax=Serendipita vermifera MAFF 305830 TaxID=933852 RepID=A0A0C3AZX6_SERVB|nr:hypothetical protein M408DRAFT_26084 [Serendipita vermifera MAFF 305830]